jgi:bifunctional polynucleotide phosphatase/kinase
MVGCPASGKTYLSEKISGKYNYCIVSQDKMKTKQKCIKEFEQMLKNEKNVIVDNTNPSKVIRQEYIQLCVKYNYHVKIVYIEIEKELAIHRNYYRMLKKNTYIPSIVYNIFYKHFQYPEINESVDEIIVLKPNFIHDSDYFKYLY